MSLSDLNELMNTWNFLLHAFFDVITMPLEARTNYSTGNFLVIHHMYVNESVIGNIQSYPMQRHPIIRFQY